MVSQRFFINWGTSDIATFLFIIFSLLAILTRLFRNTSTYYKNYSGSSIFDGKKYASSLNKSYNWICYFPGGFFMAFQVYWTFENNFAFNASTFSWFLSKSLTTNMIFLGYSEPNNRKFSSRIISSIESCDPRYNPICWIHRFIKRVWETARAKSEFLL